MKPEKKLSPEEKLELIELIRDTIEEDNENDVFGFILFLAIYIGVPMVFTLIAVSSVWDLIKLFL